MDNQLTKEKIAFLISRLVANANSAVGECKEKQNDEFEAGRVFAYYEMLDILKSELEIAEQDLKEYGLDYSLESMIV